MPNWTSFLPRGNQQGQGGGNPSESGSGSASGGGDTNTTGSSASAAHDPSPDGASYLAAGPSGSAPASTSPYSRSPSGSTSAHASTHAHTGISEIDHIRNHVMTTFPPTYTPAGPSRFTEHDLQAVEDHRFGNTPSDITDEQARSIGQRNVDLLLVARNAQTPHRMLVGQLQHMNDPRVRRVMEEVLESLSPPPEGSNVGPIDRGPVIPNPNLATIRGSSGPRYGGEYTTPQGLPGSGSFNARDGLTQPVYSQNFPSGSNPPFPSSVPPLHPSMSYRQSSYASSSSTSPSESTSSQAAPFTARTLSRDPPDVLLKTYLNNYTYSVGGVHNAAVKTRTIQRVFMTLLTDTNWHRFLLPVGGTDRMPAAAGTQGWVWRDENMVEQMFSLSALQKRMDRELVESGKPPVRKQREGKLCGKTLKRYERTYTCKTCAKDLSCVLCVECFHASEHEGHEVLFGQSFAFSASCDCGDPSAWKSGRNCGCANHPALPAGVAPGSRPSTHISDEPIPRTLIAALYKTIVILLDYIATTFQFAPIASEYARLPADMAAMRLPEQVTGVPWKLRGCGPWSVVVWADEKHTAKEFTRQIRDATGVEWETAEQYVRDIEERGRLTILTTSDPIAAFHAASVLQQIDIAAFLRPAHDAFQEDVASTCISILTDLAKCHVGGDPEVILRLIDKALHESREDDGLVTGSGLPPDLLPLALHQSPRLDWFLLQDVRLWRKPKWEMRELYCGLYSLDWESQRALATRFAVHYPRLFEIFLFHDRDADSGLLFCIAYMILGNGQASAYATRTAGLFYTVLDVAHAWFTGQVEDNKLLIPPDDIDRRDPSDESRMRPESIAAFKGKKGIALFGQLRSLLQHDEIQKMLAGDPNMFRRAVQFLNVFVGIQTQVKEYHEHVEFEVDWPKTFVYLGDLSKCAREIGESLRFCTRKPAGYVQMMIELAMRVFRDICLDSNILDKSLYERLGYEHHSDLIVPRTKSRVLAVDAVHLPAFSFHHYVDLLFAEGLKHVDVLGWHKEARMNEDGMAEYVTVCDAPVAGSGIRTVTYKQYMEEIILDGTDPDTMDLSKLILMEVPLQKHVILSHIRADMWRRNGVGMRGQAHHYRDATVRDATLDQEFFALQAGLCSMEPLNFFASVVARFGLKAFFSRDIRRQRNWESEQIEPKQYVQLLEDLLMLCIHLATDLSAVNGHSQETITRRHIIQYLGLQQMTYSELIKKLPERSIEMSLVPLLEDMADFKEPTETVQGQYSLKGHLIKEMDPYWHHYSRNDQRKAIDRILEQRKKDGNTDEVIKPLPLERPSDEGPWYNLLHWLGTPVAFEIAHYAIAHSGTIADPDSFPGKFFLGEEEKTPTLDLVLDLALHLCMLCIAFDPQPFAMAVFNKNPISGALSTFQLLWKMQMNDMYKSWWPRIEYVMESIAANVPEAYMAEYRQVRAQAAEAEAAKAPKPDARKAAAARQKAIMANFAKQQKDFAAALDFDDDDDDDDTMDEEKEEAEEVYGQCIVCQEDVTPKNTGGLLALMQPCRVMRDAVAERDWFDESLLAPTSLDQATRYHRFGMGTTGEPESTDAYPSRSHRFGAYISGCSHLMHEQCMTNYFDATRYRHTQQVQRHHPENAVRSEYLCPLCKSLGNMLVPLDKPLVTLKSYFNKDGNVPSLKEKMRDVSSEGLLKVRDSSKIWDHHVDTGELMPWFTDCTFHASTGKDQPYRREMRLSARMIERFRALVRPLSDQSQIMRQKKAHMYIPNDVVNYTISAVEVSLRGLAMPPTAMSVAEQVSESTTRLVQKLIGSMQLELDLFFGKKYDRTALRVGIFARLLPDWYRASTLPTPLVCRNPLTLVIETAAIAPDLLHSVIHMGFFAEITRLMLGSCMWIKRCLGNRQQPSPRSSPPADPHLAQALAVWRGIKQIMITALRQNAGPYTDAEPVLALLSDDEMAKIMYSHTLPYLRRCAIIFYACSGRYPAPNGLEGVDIAGTCEYTRLLRLLALPNPIEVLGASTSTEGPMVGRWLSQWASQGRMIPHLEFPGVYELARLPRKWEDVVVRYTETRCEVCKLVPANPAMCLLCGKFVCMAGDCCAEGEQGECNAHMRECGGAVGIFIDIRRWLLLYLYAGSGSFATMPYLDAHGELDINMRRNHRQYMHMGRMEDLRRQTWLQHMVPHMTARKLELTSDGGGWVSL